MNKRPSGGLIFLGGVGVVGCCLVVKTLAVGGTAALLAWFPGGSVLWGGIALACAAVLGIVALRRRSSSK